MKDHVKKSIESYLEGFLQGLINKYDPKVIKDEILKKSAFDEKKGKYKPFHAALIPFDLLRIQSFLDLLVLLLARVFLSILQK